MNEISKVLGNGEKILWEGGPKFGAYMLTGSIPTFIFGMVWSIFLIPFIFVGFMGPNLISTIPGPGIQNFSGTNHITGFMSVFSMGWNVILIPFVLIGIWMLVGVPLYKFFVHKHLYYMVTDKRVIFQKGLIGRDFEYIDFDKITNVEVDVGFWDKALGGDSGSILISSAGSITYGRHGEQISTPYTLSNVQNPYNVFKFIKTVSYDVKTDIQYPNKLRPTENPGYNTDYNPNKVDDGRSN